jgi:hypothetical protein
MMNSEQLEEATGIEWREDFLSGQMIGASDDGFVDYWLDETNTGRAWLTVVRGMYETRYLMPTLDAAIDFINEKEQALLACI